MTEEARALRRTFDEDPLLHDRTRPGYPPEVFEGLAELAGLHSGLRVLELGCGTDQATSPVAESGYRIVALVLGKGMAALARRKLAAFSSVEVVHAAFEDWPVPPEPYHIAGGDERFFEEVQRCYERWMPGTQPAFRLPSAADIPDASDELDGCERFAASVCRRHEWERTDSTSEYLDLLQSYSGHRALERAAREALLACVAELVDGAYGGKVTKRYLTELRVARLAG